MKVFAIFFFVVQGVLLQNAYGSIIRTTGVSPPIIAQPSVAASLADTLSLLTVSSLLADSLPLNPNVIATVPVPVAVYCGCGYDGCGCGGCGCGGCGYDVCGCGGYGCGGCGYDIYGCGGCGCGGCGCGGCGYDVCGCGGCGCGGCGCGGCGCGGYGCGGCGCGGYGIYYNKYLY